MSSKRKSFVLHKDSLDILPDLTDEQAGKLFKAIHSYQKNEPFELDQIVKMVFLPFKNQFNRDDEKYNETCERRAIAGSKGGKQKVANASNSKQRVANVADSDSKSVSKSKSDSDSKSKNVPLDFTKWTQTPSQEILKDFLAMRKRKKHSVSQYFVNNSAKQIATAITSGWSVDDCLSYWLANEYQGFKAEWMGLPHNIDNNGNFTPRGFNQ